MATLTQFEVAQLIESCAYAAARNDDTYPINRHGVVIGEHAWDNCQCGLLVVSETRRFGSRDFPLEEIDREAECGEPWLVVDYLLSLTRCVPVPDDQGNPPSIEALQASAEQLSADMTTVRRAVQCCLDEAYRTNTLLAWQLGPQSVVGPLGDCAGFTLQIFAGWTNDCGC